MGTDNYFFGDIMALIILPFLLVAAIIWIILPFAIFGIKGRLDRLIIEQFNTNKWLKYISEQNQAILKNGSNITGKDPEES